MTTTTPQSSPTEANGNGPEKRNLAQKLLAVASAIEDIDLDGKNDHFKYEYATAANILRHVRKPLADEGVLLLTSLESIEERAKGNSTLTTVKVRFTFVDTEAAPVAPLSPQDAQLGRNRAVAPSRYEFLWAGQGDDPSDKGLAKAYTSAIKTFLRETFLLPLGDDPEADTRADKRSEGDVPPAIDTIDGEAVAELVANYEALKVNVEDKDKLARAVKVMLGSIGVPTPSLNKAFGSLTPAQRDDVANWLETYGNAS